MEIDMKPLLAEVAKRHSFRLDSDDPEIAIVTLNQLVLEKCMEELLGRVRSAIAEIEKTGKRAETRAVAYIAEEVKECAVVVRQELQKDIEAARLRATATVVELNSAHRRTSAIREKWVAVGLIISTLLVGLAFWAGYIAR